MFDNDYQIILSSESAPIIGGLIVEREDYDLDLSFESLLQGIRDNYEPELAKMLLAKVNKNELSLCEWNYQSN